ncbi:BA14K family protein [Neorhizobium lilium]|uniref:Lectin-like protein BA14k n=1 Tax=Neorhizobium lilium TaxID=2503024 RepID=A0A444LDG1_9HYPH|nr:BA14K family protein [Neorhizobium lilium]RWX75797.1 BA14K family protein [Neorhizobium lilium]
MKKLAIIAVSVMTAFTGVLPAQAMPLASAPKVETQQTADVQQVQYWRHRDGRWGGNRDNWGGNRGSWGRDRHDYNGNRYYRDRYSRHHRGSNAGAIIGGLAAGAIIGGALAQPRYAAPRRYVGGNSHVEWCYSRYRSYRASDNTFQPNNGPRRQCNSPY